MVALRDKLRQRNYGSEMIRPGTTIQFNSIGDSMFTGPSLDLARPDYSFFDRAGRGNVKGLELSGLLLKPLASRITEWVAGRPPTWIMDDNEGDQKFLNDWWEANHTDVLRCVEESVRLGSSYMVVNPDLSTTIIPPNIVLPLQDDRDLSVFNGWKVVETYQRIDTAGMGAMSSMLDSMQKVYEYTASARFITNVRNGVPGRRHRFANPLGYPTIIHVPNIRSSDEMFGRPDAEPIIQALFQYNEALSAAIRGNIRQGRPTPVVENIPDAATMKLFWDTYGRLETVKYPDGTSRQRYVVDWDPNQLLTLVGTSSFKYASPMSSSADTLNLLEILFYLILQHTQIPEFVWGNALAGSRASSESQLEPFVKWVEKRRGRLEKYLIEIARVVLGIKRFKQLDSDFESRPQLRWPSLTTADGRLTLDTLMWADARGLMGEIDVLERLPVQVRDPEQMLERGRTDKKRRDKEAADLQAASQPQRQITNSGKITQNTGTPTNARPSGPPAKRDTLTGPEKKNKADQMIVRKKGKQ